MLNPSQVVYVAGHRGMVGSAIVRRFQEKGYQNIVTRTHRELDLMDQAAVRRFFRETPIDCVVLAAAKVGGIHANNAYPAEFIYNNLAITTNVISEAYRHDVKRLVFLGSSCIYPREAPQPLKEEHLLTGLLEPTNEPYAVAKIAGIKLCESFNRQYGVQYRSIMPTNLYGPNDNYDLETSHVFPALIRKFHLAKLVIRKDYETIEKDEAVYGPIPMDIRSALGLGSAGKKPRVKLWGTGNPMREFLHVDDMAFACVFMAELDDETYSRYTLPMLSHVNVGAGKEISIKNLAKLIAETVGYKGDIIWDASKPDGTTQKLLDVSKAAAMGWESEISLLEGIRLTYAAYRKGLDAENTNT